MYTYVYVYIIIYIYIYTYRCPPRGQSQYCHHYGCQRVRLKNRLNFEGWNSQARREFPGKFESSDLSRDNATREMGSRRASGIIHGDF